MNRQDKIQKLHDKRLKRARAKLKTSSKERYISKADRVKTEVDNSEVDYISPIAKKDTLISS